MESYRAFIIAFKQLSTDTGSDCVSLSELQKHLQLNDKDFNYLRLNLLRDGYIARASSRQCKLLRDENSIEVFLQNENSLQDIDERQLDLYIIELRERKSISVEKFFNDLKSIKHFMRKAEETYAISTRLNMENETVEFVAHLNPENFFADFDVSYKWPDDDCKAATYRLLELFSFDELYQLTGEPGRLIRNIIRFESGHDDNSRKLELASFAVAKYRNEFFRHNFIFVSEIYKKFDKEIHPWVSGSKNAINFVAEFGFPRSFAGEPQQSLSLPNYIPPLTALPELRNYQTSARQQISEMLNTAGARVLLQMPVGAGRVRVAIEAMNSWFRIPSADDRNKVIIWISKHADLSSKNSDDVLTYYLSNRMRDFAVEVYPAWGNIFEEKFLGESESECVRRLQSSDARHSYILTDSIFLNAFADSVTFEKWIAGLAVDSNLLFVVDENIGEMNACYLELFQKLTEAGSDYSVLGLTESWSVEENQKVHEDLKIFNNNIVNAFTDKPAPYKHLVEMQFVAQPVFAEIAGDFHVKIADVQRISSPTLEPEHQQKVEQRLIAGVKKWSRVKGVADRISKLIESNSKILYFAASDFDAELMSWSLRKLGVDACALLGSSDRASKNRVTKDFAADKFKVLCTVEIPVLLNEKSPLTHVVVGRPSLSTALINEVVNVGLRGRKLGGAQELNVIYVRDRFETDAVLSFAFDKIKDKWQQDLNSSEPVGAEVLHENFVVEPAKIEGDDEFDDSQEAEVEVAEAEGPAEENVIAMEEYAEFEETNEESEQSEENDDIQLEEVSQAKETYFELDEDFEINVSNTVDGIFNWLFNEIVGESEISSVKLTAEFKTVNRHNLENFFENLADRLKQKVEVDAIGFKIAADMGTASKLSLNKAIIKQLIKTTLLTQKNQKAA